jgi:hypothetical protein
MPIYDVTARAGAIQSLAEQVTGRRKRVLVQILLEAAAVPEVLGGLRDRVGTDIIWWQLPVQGFGRIS